ncbi:hypothetical protein Adt_29462 [Abeliophyllum distichum]|uniref:Uncharacterized protein n=1 Tax=Abeliophyllum distichum TaxID=126358 RepID=A0ABD1RA54_9LAMI
MKLSVFGKLVVNFGWKRLSTSLNHTKLNRSAHIFKLSNTFFSPPQALTTDNNDSITNITTASSSSTITVQNDDELDSTLFKIQARNKLRLLQVITRVFKVLGPCCGKSQVLNFEVDFFIEKFYVTNSDGKKIENVENLENIQKALMEAIEPGDASGDA